MAPGELQQLQIAPLQPELSRVVRLDEISGVANTVIIDANSFECTQLAERFDIPYLRNLSAEVTYRRTRGGQMIRIEGRITANYSQICSATLTPMPMAMEESFQTEYTLSAWEKFSDFDLDQPEVLTDDFIDIGEIASQYFGLAIDPYARRAGHETLEDMVSEITAAVAELAAQSGATPALPDRAAQEDVAATEEAPPLMKTAEIILLSDLRNAKIEAEITQADPEESLAEPEPEPAQTPPESLFFRYLRELRER